MLLVMLPFIAACSQKSSPKQHIAESGASYTEAEKIFPDTNMIRGNNQFAFDIYPYVRNEAANTFFSPFSISAAMAMTYAGAHGESEKQIREVMHFDARQTHFHPAYQALLQHIAALNRPDETEILTAHSVYAQKDYTFLADYFSLLSLNYYAEIQNLDFRKDAEGARKAINKRVGEQTKNKISELIAEGTLGDLTRLVLVNAIYYYGLWEKEFKVSDSRQLPFYVHAEQKVTADFMVMSSEFNYLETIQYKLVEIPYKGGGLSMLVYLPAGQQDINGLEKELHAAMYRKSIKSLSKTKIELYFPKFKTTSDFELSDVMKKMGMPHPFSHDADLSGMTGKQDLMIDKVIHQAFVEVNEKGTEAAAATAVVIREKSAPILPVFRADHPFIFIIKENTYHNILFMGRINNPAS
jgi:serpin B